MTSSGHNLCITWPGLSFGTKKGWFLAEPDTERVVCGEGVLGGSVQAEGVAGQTSHLYD